MALGHRGRSFPPQRWGVHETGSTPADGLERVLDSGPPLPTRFPPFLHELYGPVDGRFEDGRIERGSDGVEDRAFEGLLGHVQMVSAHRGPALAVVGAPVEEAPPPTVVAAHGDQGAATQGASAEPAQEVGRGEIETMTSSNFVTNPTGTELPPSEEIGRASAQDAVDAKPRVPEALVGVALFVHFAAPRFTAMRSWALQVRKSVVSGRPILRT